MKRELMDLLNFLIILIIVFALTMARAIHADQCRDTLELCNSAVHALDASNKALEQQIKVQNDYIEALKKQATTNDSILPTWGWVLIGGVLGGAAVEIAK